MSYWNEGTKVCLGVAVVVSIFTLAATCDYKPDWVKEQERQAIAREAMMQPLYRGEVQVVAKSPDGTVLYRAWDPCTQRVIFFSKSGSQWQTQYMSGKVHVTQDHQTPAQ